MYFAGEPLEDKERIIQTAAANSAPADCALRAAGRGCGAGPGIAFLDRPLQGAG
jgi:hypothetical protein